MNDKPILLLDIDGVINAFDPTRPHVTRKVGGRWTKNGSFTPYTLRFDNEVVEMIDALSEHFEIHWATMWNGRANHQVAPVLGIEGFPVMTCSHEAGYDAAIARGLRPRTVRFLWYAKTPLIPSYVKGRPFAWVDDDHTFEDKIYLRKHEAITAPFLLHKTDAKTGLTWADVADLITWAESLSVRV